MTAIISPCGAYRYWLERGLPNQPYVAWVLANPSTADAEIDDPTVRKGRGFTSRWGYDRFVFVNLFGGRSTDPKGLLKMSDPVGAENEKYMTKAVDGADLVVLAWGNAVVKQLRRHTHFAVEFIRCRVPDEKIKCLGRTGDGQPRHPLMLAYSTPLEPYTQAGHSAAQPTPSSPQDHKV